MEEMSLSKYSMSIWQKITVFVVFFLGLMLRLHNYDVYPQRGATSDEYSYSFQGVSLLTKGIPISWSIFSAYRSRGVEDLTIRKIYFPIVKPYFDHTPLNGILVGAWSIIFGQDTFETIDLKTIRLIPIFLSMISSLLVFLLGKKIFGIIIGIWALLIYSVVTTFVMNGRVVFAENLMTPFFLLSIFLFTSFKRAMTIHKTIILGFLSGLAFWTKESGIAVFMSLLYLFVKERVNPKWILWLMAIMTAFVGIYVAYGVYFDKELFFAILRTQADRDIGPQTLLYILSNPIIVNKVYLDGWYFFGFLTIFLCFFDFEKQKYIIIPSLVYLLILLITLTQKGEMGWYIIPLFPFMSLAIARVIQLGLAKHHWLIYLFVLFIGNYLIQYYFTSIFGLVASQYRLLIAIIIGPLLLFDANGQEKHFVFIGKTWFYLFLFATAYLTYTYIHPA